MTLLEMEQRNTLHSWYYNKLALGKGWYSSYEIACIVNDGEILFEVTSEDKELIENNIDGVKFILEYNMDAKIENIEFTEFDKDTYGCSVYYKKMETAYQEDLDNVIEDNNLKNEEGNGMCPFKELTWIAEDYPQYFDGDNAEYEIADDIIAKLGENYTCFYTEDNMYFWDKTKWTFDSAEMNFKAL